MKLFFIVVSSAFLAVLIFTPYGFPLVFVFLVPYFIFLIQENSVIKLFLGSFLFKLIYWLVLTYFILDPLPYLWLVAIFLALPAGIIVLKRVIRSAGYLLLLTFVSVGYSIVDYLAVKYSLIPAFIGYLGVALGNGYFLGLAKYGGLFGLGLFAALINGVLAFFILEYIDFYRRSIKIRRFADVKNFIFAVIFALFILFLGIFISQWGIADRKKEYVSLNNSFKAAIISVDYDFDGGFYPSPRYFSLEQIAFIENFIAKKISVLEEQLKNKHFDLVVLPEALLDVELSDSADAKALTDFKISNNDVLIREFSGLAKRLKTPLLANFVTIREKNRYNSAVFFGVGGEILGIYDKNILVYGGEYWPFGNWHPFYYDIFRSRLSPRLPVFNSKYAYTPGSSDKIFNLARGARFGVLICLESQIPDRVATLERAGVNFLINPSSNNWIKIGLENYLFMSLNLRRIMAVSSNKPIIISGRRDYAGIIFPDGRVEIADFKTPLNLAIYEGEIRF